MAHKDYIQRGNPKATKRPVNKTVHKVRADKRTTSRSTTRSTPRSKKTIDPLLTRKPFPWAVTSIAFLIFIGFGYFLWTIKGAAQDGAQPIASIPIIPVIPVIKQDKPTSAVAKNAPSPELPPPPKHEQWQYIEALKNKTVEVEVEAQEQKGPYVMQCATFKDPQRAEAFRAQLALLGYESRIKVTKSANGERHRVQLGPFEMNRDAQKVRHQLSKHHINGCKIWLWS